MGARDTEHGVTTADLARRDRPYWGWVDRVSDEEITGWAVAQDAARGPLALELFHDGTRLGRCFTEGERPDIAKSLGRPVRAGFRFDLRRMARRHPELLSDLVGVPLQLRIAGSDMRVGPDPVLDEEVVRSLSREAEGPLLAISRKRELVSRLTRDLSVQIPNATARAIAFYLPQFHSVDANEEWWGAGFTEWSNVAQARSFYAGHMQPRVPTSLGYYDLSAPATYGRQVELARASGIFGFCIYSYWFDGERLLNEPLDRILGDGEPDFPYCLCWANENWSRRWDGENAELLISQTHDLDSDSRYIETVIPHFKDPRYITVDGAPVLLVYRVGLLADPLVVTQNWREAARRAGFEDLYLVMAQTFGDEDPTKFGFDAAVEFPPHGFPASDISSQIPTLSSEFRGKVYDYEGLVARALAAPEPEYIRHRTVMPSWDNTPRRDVEGHIYRGSTPGLFQAWLSHAVATTAQVRSPSNNFVFINAWNEWAEGAHLEPDNIHGTSYLDATRAALAGATEPHGALKALRARTSDNPGDSALVDALERSLDALEQANRVLRDMHRQQAEYIAPCRFREGLPEIFVGTRAVPGAQLWIERLGPHADVPSVVIPSGSRTVIAGWSLCPQVEQRHDTVSLLLLTGLQDEPTYSAFIHGRYQRQDVIDSTSEHVPSSRSQFSGFRLMVDFAEVKPGSYTLSVVYPLAEQPAFGEVDGVLHVC